MSVLNDRVICPTCDCLDAVEVRFTSAPGHYEVRTLCPACTSIVFDEIVAVALDLDRAVAALHQIRTAPEKAYGVATKFLTLVGELEDEA